MKGILKLAPLFRIFRGQVEASELPLENVKTLAQASDLVVTKIRWLLPSQVKEDPALEDEELGDITGMVSATYVPAMEPWELHEATENLKALLGDAARRYPRGATSLMGAPTTIVTSVDPRELREAMRLVAAKSEPVRRNPRHPEVEFRRPSAQLLERGQASGGKACFSASLDFLGKDKKEAIQNFLAFLELIKRRRVFARQTGPFGEIVFGTDQDRVLSLN